MRDYGIDLPRDIHNMSWRRFEVLSANLSATGAVAMRIQSMEGRSNEMDQKQAAEAFFSSVVRL